MANKLEKGQSLMEVIIALAVASLVAVGLVRVGVTAIKSSRFSRDQSRMVNFAQGKIAAIVNYKNKSSQLFWDGHYFPDGDSGNTREEFISDEGYCLFTTISDVTGQLPPSTPDPNAKMAQINVKIFWDEKGIGTQCDGKNFNHSLNFDTYVTN